MEKKTCNKRKIIALILVIIWMAVVFYFSNQQGGESSNTSSRVSNLIVKVITIGQELSDEKIVEIEEIIDPIIRKLAHYILYSLGGFLIINYIDIYNWKIPKKVFYSIFVGAIYASTDELHQFFVKGRSSQVSDVMIDTLGVATGVFIFLVFIKPIIKYILKKTKSNSL